MINEHDGDDAGKMTHHVHEKSKNQDCILKYSLTLEGHCFD